MSTTDREPEPDLQNIAFESWDFEALAPDRSRSPEYNDRRLSTRRRLAAIAQGFLARSEVRSLGLESRTSLHNPHTFNGMRVQRQWAYVCRGKKEKGRLKRVLGRDLAKDLDSAFKNAYLCVAIEHEALEVSLRIHPDGWYDGQNLVHRTRAEGLAGWLGHLNELAGFHLRLHDWKGEFPCGALTVERLEEFLRYYTPGEHRLAVERRWPATGAAREAALTDEVPAELVAELGRLVPLYRYLAWSEESDFLFAR